MRRKFPRLTLITILLLIFASNAHAFYFIVTLKNGTSFETRYRPRKADFDENYSLIITDQANTIAVRTDEIADITSREQESGFGYRLDTSTVFVGWSPNDLVETDEETGEVKQKYEASGDNGTSDYSIDKFLNVPASAPGSVGGGGFPVAGGGGGGGDGGE